MSAAQNAVLSMLTLGVLATVASLRVFGKSRVVFWRESAAGISVFSRYLATVLVDLIDITLRPFFFVLVYRSFIYPSITFTCVNLIPAIPAPAPPPQAEPGSFRGWNRPEAQNSQN